MTHECNRSGNPKSLVKAMEDRAAAYTQGPRWGPHKEPAGHWVAGLLDSHCPGAGEDVLPVTMCKGILLPSRGCLIHHTATSDQL
ncbi:hypothetical protein GDO78_014379 [Eleutherodactylus coqui]|uniref:Uncharacterized protein n=1 Tax=Eleutherodactylus coqui TaxID=57060 RepID=A0A8J6E8W5_ELECQ|nr:hypothetical protein GDO78_014379 [Eleutherodactylus coqui]